MNQELIKEEIKSLQYQCSLWLLQTRLTPESRIILEKVIKKLSNLSQEFAPPSPSKLTPREKEILYHVSQGFSNREIASALDISEKTIEFHLKSIFNKLEVTTRTEAVSMAFKSGWL